MAVSVEVAQIDFHFDMRMSDGKTHTTSIPISLFESFLFGWFEGGRREGGEWRVVYLGMSPEALRRTTAIERGRLNDNIDTANQNHQSLTVANCHVLQTVQSAMTYSSKAMILGVTSRSS